MPPPPPASGATGRMGTIRHQLLAFALVGGIGFVLDLVVFNALRLTVLAPEVHNEGPILAKLISTAVAILANWLGNRYWTFGPHRRNDSWREGSEFFLVSLLGMAVGLGCLWVSHYVLGYTSVLADNISSNVIGLALGSIVRFALYRHWVFHPARSRAKSPDAEGADAETADADEVVAAAEIADADADADADAAEGAGRGPTARRLSGRFFAERGT